MLKDGWCTALFYAFTCDKQATLQMKGGNTDELYFKNKTFDGRLEMARSLQQQHPDVCYITKKWNRWQHQVNYRLFRGNKLKLKSGVNLDKMQPNEYGMKLIQLGEK